MGVLIDTGVFFGFYSKRDKQHSNAIALIIHALQGKWGRPYITDHILDETINILKYRISHEISMEFLKAFIFSKNVEVITAEKEHIDAALTLYRQNYNLKGFSFTDALSVVITKTFDLDYILTFDKHLKKFVPIIGPSYVNTLTKEEIYEIQKYLGEVNECKNLSK
ncbi:MAG: type II toxin-antitoxin system VapC family toxin [Candidatus Njordarchaeales archaeon]